ncbi:hypothetical protein [Listeria booriae]|uniref:hypothetical protein n=1 Tax=Listeria booriae TaxID=1552123 RepID=UPI00163D41E1|nr:hypothetical protein [Listeria booriae]MBC1309324.1 hypothetical protein [Listeria booriae]
MLQVYFQVDKKHRKLLRTVVEMDRGYPLTACNELLVKADTIVEENACQVDLEFAIREDEELVFRDMVALGEGYPMNILLLVNQSLHDVFVDVAEADKKQLLHRLEQAFLAPEQPQKYVSRDSPAEEALQALEKPVEPVKAKIEQPIVIPKEAAPKKEAFSIPIEEKIEEGKSTEKKQARKRVKFQVDVSRYWHKKSYRIAILCLFVVVISGIAIMLWPQQQEQAQAEGPTKPSIETLIEHENLKGIAKWYPKRWGDVIQAYVEDANLSGLKQILAYAPSVNLKIDIAFFEKDFPTIIQLYEKNKEDIYTKTDYAFIGFSYLTQGKLEQAEVLNLYADDADLKAYIADYRLTKTTLDETNKLLKRTDLSAAMKQELQEKKLALEAHIKNYKEGKVEVESSGKRKEAI